MRITILSSGALLVRQKDQEWLFGIPKDIKDTLEQEGIDIPKIAFTTGFKAPGLGNLGPVITFKEQPLRINGLSAIPIKHKHGTDYAIDSGDARILFSERGDVSFEDVKDFHLAIIKNKHRSDKFGDNVITWPWPNAEYIVENSSFYPLEISTKVWSSVEDIPDNLKKIDGIPLDVEQANFIARIAKGSADGPDENWAIGISAFKKAYQKKNGTWVRKNTEKSEKESDKLSKGIEKEGGKLNEIISISVNKDNRDTYYVNFGDWATDETVKAVKKVLGSVEYEMESPPNQDKWEYIWEYSPKYTKKKENEMLKLLSQEKAQYKDDAGDDAGLKVCANCEYYCQDMTCKKVEGDINPGGVCVIWEWGKEDEIPNMAEYSYMETSQESEKEYDEGVPIPRFLDVLTAALHKAYNDTSDHLFELGYLSQDERMKVAQSIGKGLSAVRDALEPEEFAERKIDKWDLPIKYVTKENLTLKALAPGVPDKIEDFWVSVYKENNQDRWATISSVAVWDRQNELFSTKAMDWAINFAKLINYKGPLRYRHIPGLDGGDCDTQVRVGDFLFESGTFRDTPMGHKLKELMNDPAYKVSLGLVYAKDDIKNGVYQRAAIFERSLTKQPAVVLTSAIKEDNTMTVKMLTETELRDLAIELDMDFESVKSLYEQGIKGGNVLGFKEFREVALKANGGGANAATDDEDEEADEGDTASYSKKEMIKIIEGLSIAEYKELQQIMKAAKQNIDEDDEDEEEIPMKVKKEAKRLDKLEELVSTQGEMLLQQTKAMTELANAIVGKQNQDGLNSAVTNFLSQAPREQASRFVSTSVKSNDSVPDKDQEILKALKSLEDKMAQMPGGKTDIYNAFTSRNLNRGQ